MVDDHQPAVTRMVFRNSDNSIGSRMNRSAVIRGHIHAGVKRAFPTERIQSLAETVGNVAHDRPERGRVCGVRKTHWGRKLSPPVEKAVNSALGFRDVLLHDEPVKGIL